jgi:adenosyl cobinamide kinase/adenosyl cobinamide phosphate guanylyltransferase
VLGGTRSGKSRYAEALLADAAGVGYVATARTDPSDREWTDRIAVHRARRPGRWRTIEDADLVAVLDVDPGPLLVDDIGTWLARVVDDCDAWSPAAAGRPLVQSRITDLVAAVARHPGRMVIVSSEVGMGVVPATRAGRYFRDELGAANAALAQVCDEVVVLISGLPLRLKETVAG